MSGWPRWMPTSPVPRCGSMRSRPPSRASRLPVLPAPGDVAVIVSSGGSTGVPKGSWRTFAAYSAMVGVPSPADRRQLVNGRLAYLSEVLVDITLLGGGVVVLKDGYEAADTLATIEAERITDLFLVEPQLFELMDHPDVASRDLSTLRTLTHIGASAPPTLRLRARTVFGPVLVHTYGASEEGLVSVLSPAEYDPAFPERFTSAGRILPHVEVRLRKDDGTLAGPGEVGGIEVRSPGMAQGYRNRPDLEAAAFRDGWYRSGDLGRIDGDGYLHVLGRAVDMAWIDGSDGEPDPGRGHAVPPADGALCGRRGRPCQRPLGRGDRAVAGRQPGRGGLPARACSRVRARPLPPGSRSCRSTRCR